MSLALTPLCHAVLSSQGSLVGSLFLAGLVGSATHCAGMCGPFVLSQATAHLDAEPMVRVSEWRRLQGAALLPYHVGRMVTYIALGLAATLVSAQFHEAAWFHGVSAVVLVVAGLMFVASAFRFLPLSLPHFSVALPRGVKARMDALFARPLGGRGFALGLILGLLPCGLVYAALLAVMATGKPLVAVAGMMAFAVGTIPALIAVGYGGHHVFRRWGSSLRYIVPLVMLFNGGVLFVMAGGLM